MASMSVVALSIFLGIFRSLTIERRVISSSKYWFIMTLLLCSLSFRPPRFGEGSIGKSSSKVAVEVQGEGREWPTSGPSRVFEKDISHTVPVKVRKKKPNENSHMKTRCNYTIIVRVVVYEQVLHESYVITCWEYIYIYILFYIINCMHARGHSELNLLYTVNSFIINRVSRSWWRVEQLLSERCGNWLLTLRHKY